MEATIKVKVQTLKPLINKVPAIIFNKRLPSKNNRKTLRLK